MCAMSTFFSKTTIRTILAVIAFCTLTALNIESAYAQQVVRCPSCGGSGAVLVGYNYYGQPMYNYCPTCGGRGQVVTQGANPSFRGGQSDELIGTIYPYFYNWQWIQSKTAYKLYKRPNGSLYVVMSGSSSKIDVSKSSKSEWTYQFYQSGYYYFN